MRRQSGQSDPSASVDASAPDRAWAACRWLVESNAGHDRVRSVGVMMDYFAATRPELDALDLDAGPAGNDWPYVDCKGWILEVQEFAAEIDGRDPSEFGQDEP